MSLRILLQGDPRAPHQVRLGAALAARGHRVYVANAPEIAQRIRTEHGQTCDEVTLENWGPHWWRLARHWFTLRDLRIDVVHLNYILTMYRTWANLPGGPPYIATAWGSDLNNDEFMRMPKYERAMKRILHRAAAITTDSHQLLDRAKTLAGPRVSAELVLWGVDIDVFDRQRVLDDTVRWRAELGIESGQRVLLSPRQTLPFYHPEEIIRGFAASDWSQGGVLLVKCHGRPKEAAYVDELKALTRDLGIEQCVRFVAPCPYDRLPGLYCLADAAVSALHVDGFPSTFSELFALQVPVVATNLLGYTGLLDDGKNAVLFEPGNQASLVRALNRLHLDTSLSERLRHEGTEFVKQRADFRVNVDRYEAIYHEVVEKRRRNH
jgi:glycosyltransferase involved in cell wall biosynthesis